MWNAQFRPGDFRWYFNRHAERVLWYQAVLCPCGSQPGQPSSINCKTCGGLGRFYPKAPVTTLMVLTAVQQRTMIEDVGELIPGDMTADQPPGAAPVGMLDLIQTPWGQPFEGQQVLRGVGSSDTLFYRPASVLWCGTVSPSGGVTATYTQGTDFNVSGKQLQWVAGHGPASGVLYSVRYDAFFEWSPLYPGQVRIERGTNLGQRNALRKRHLVLGNSPNLVVSG